MPIGTLRDCCGARRRNNRPPELGDGPRTGHGPRGRRHMIAPLAAVTRATETAEPEGAWPIRFPPGRLVRAPRSAACSTGPGQPDFADERRRSADWARTPATVDSNGRRPPPGASDTCHGPSGSEVVDARCAGGDINLLSGIRPSPRRQGHLLLQDHVIGEDRGQANRGRCRPSRSTPDRAAACAGRASKSAPS